MAVTFKRHIKWPNNELLLPPTLFGVEVPAGLTGLNIRAPNFVDATEMGRVSRANSTGGSGGGIAILSGLVTAGVSLRFADPDRQWTHRPSGGGTATHGPALFQFAGGDVHLDMTLGIYIQHLYRPQRDPISVEMFALVYSHELLHVLDEVSIFNTFMPPRLSRLPNIGRYLSHSGAFLYGRRGQPIAEVKANFLQHMHNRLETEIHNLWATEHNRRQAIRDAPAEYQHVSDAIQDLRIRQINAP